MSELAVERQLLSARLSDLTHDIKYTTFEIFAEVKVDFE